jgi:hypothetical protein
MQGPAAAPPPVPDSTGPGRLRRSSSACIVSARVRGPTRVSLAAVEAGVKGRLARKQGTPSLDVASLGKRCGGDGGAGAFAVSLPVRLGPP